MVVVLPEPCRPHIRHRRRAGSPDPAARSRSPSSSTRWSWTIFTTIWPGVMLRITSWPMAFSRTAATKSRTTGSATSASSSAMRTSRSASHDIVLAERAAALQPVEDVAEPGGQVLEHRLTQTGARPDSRRPISSSGRGGATFAAPTARRRVVCGEPAAKSRWETGLAGDRACGLFDCGHAVLPQPESDPPWNGPPATTCSPGACGRPRPAQYCAGSAHVSTSTFGSSRPPP